MSTSPSWFDQEKFSRLLKKKPAAKASPAAPATPAVAPSGGDSALAPVPQPPQVPPAPPFTATSPLGRASTGPLPPVPRAGSGTLPILSSRTSTGPLPPPRRSSGPLPASAGPPSTGSLPPPGSRTGALTPPPPAQRPSTGPLPPPPVTRPTASLPPPPLRPLTEPLPLPRAPSGPLPTLPVRDTADDFQPSGDFSAPASSSFEKNPTRPSVPLPDFKPLFGYEEPAAPAEGAKKSAEDSTSSGETSSAWFDPNASEPVSGEERTAALGFDPANVPVESTDPLGEENEPGDTPKQLQELDEQLSLVTEERDQSRAELELIRQKLDASSTPGSHDDPEAAGRERDEARLEVIVLRSQLEAAEQTQRDTEAMASQLEELSHVIDERDSVRRDYAVLREQFETLKLDRSRGDATEATQALETENRQLREQLAKAGTAGGTSEPVSSDVAALREELKKAKEEASMSSRGLALSQKALQETREALKAAGEGSSSSKGNLDDQKKERATLVRQNMLLQGQNEQLTRDLSAAKAKLGAKGA